MNPDNEKKYQRLRSLFFGLCIVAAGMLFLSSASNIYKSTAAAHWPVHKGTVTNELRGALAGGYYGGRWLEYSYEVDGKEYRGTRIGFGISRPQTALKNGELIQVYVDPDDKNIAVIAVGISRSHFIGLLFSVGFVWLGFVIWRRTQ
ncbi:hypothetical protein O59_002114 [Cellvibrio sp. BR]|jgi:hypothetical protein|uniref:DUF3592 domain-containing protein n=1 Tax=unclassified Cellvibrio TaxID=2624793 RepID=UPI000260176F|nr:MULTISPECIES: DUF3592 domain-containing protein [unclassified Cellvibrio]EIK45436.1 hypothetical protein O59_002114 [Cellvibrio sp. BR]QEY13470.1 DUF3592 domain-containing protein [Cellvibrio sp. KY-YJ-3]UUA73179.1 DUF3592 domain-containing protein [Cellvibrio sp. QJXJ]